MFPILLDVVFFIFFLYRMIHCGARSLVILCLFWVVEGVFLRRTGITLVWQPS